MNKHRRIYIASAYEQLREQLLVLYRYIVSEAIDHFTQMLLASLHSFNSGIETLVQFQKHFANMIVQMKTLEAALVIFMKLKNSIKVIDSTL